MTSTPYLFASYSREDRTVVGIVVERLRARGVDVWVDADRLSPGENFQAAIRDALAGSSGLLVFMSRGNVGSDWLRDEVAAAAAGHGLLIPVMLEDVPFESVPAELQVRQWIRLVGGGLAEIDQVVDQIVDVVVRAGPLEELQTPLSSDDANAAAESLASETRRQSDASDDASAPPNSVFIVHGHDRALVAETEAYVNDLGIEAVVLTQVGGPAQSLFQKFMTWGTNTRFAIVLMTADDYGASRAQYEADGVGERSLQFRARQNVVLELGFFYGHLGWENVFVLSKGPDRVYPNFERPSDLAGVVFDNVDEDGLWRDALKRRLEGAGFDI